MNTTAQATFQSLYNGVGSKFALEWAKSMAISTTQVQLWVIQLINKRGN